MSTRSTPSAQEHRHPPRVQLGDLGLTLVHDGVFRLDGGAMFGVVPKALWSRHKPADELNRIAMVTNCLLVERGDDLLLVDTAVGDKGDAKFHKIFGLEEGAQRLPSAIEAAGYELGDVTHVLLSHLHFDHCGWNTTRDGEGWKPTFPNARYWLQRGEVAHARQPNERDGASYDPRNWEPLFEAGVVELFDEQADPIPGVQAVRVPGHNADMCIVRLDGTGDGDFDPHAEHQGVFFADLIPTAAHVQLPWIMGYDLYPLQTLANKKHWLPQAVEGDWLCIFEHDPDLPMGRVVEPKPGKFKALER